MIKKTFLFSVFIFHFLTGQEKDTLLSIGAKAPGFFLKTRDQKEFYASDFFGAPRELPKSRKERNFVVLSFFSTTCAPCRKEIPELEKLQIKFPDIKFFLIDVGETEDTVEKFLLSFPIKLPILLDRYGVVAEKYKIKEDGPALAVLPTLVMINKEGQVSFYKKGYRDGDENKMEEEILNMMK